MKLFEALALLYLRCNKCFGLPRINKHLTKKTLVISGTIFEIIFALMKK